ncbi:MAG: hypothetical protein ABR581_10985 [Thermoleophilaceae bacterium]
MSSGTQQPEAVIRQYLEEQGGTAKASLHHLLTTFGVDPADENGRQRIEIWLAEAGVIADRRLSGLAEDDEITLSLEPSAAGPETGAAAYGSSREPDKSKPAEAPTGRSPVEDHNDAPVRVCRKCSVQTRTFSDRCPNCGASYVRGLARLPGRTKALLLAVPILILLAAAGAGVALKIRHDNDVKKHKRERAKRERERRDRARLKRRRDELTISIRTDLVKELESAVTKDARKTVADGLLDGPVLRSSCDPLSGGPKDLAAHRGRFECLAINKTNDDGSYEGYRYSASIDYDSGTYRWRLGGG